MRQPLFILFLQIRRAIDDDAARLFHDCEISLCRRQGFFQSLAVPFFDAHLGTADLFRRSRLFLSIFRQKVTDVDVFTIFDFDGYRHGPAVLEDDLVAAIVEDADRVALRVGMAPFIFPIGLGIADGRQVGDRRFFRVGLALRILTLLLSPGCCCWVWVCCFCGWELVGVAGVQPAAMSVKSMRTIVR